jgi:hypothetical protein
MEVLKVGRTRQTRAASGRHRTSTGFVMGQGVRKVNFETESTVPFLESNLGDIWIAPALVLAMRNGMELRLRDPISPGRREDLDVIQDVLATWYPDRMTKVPIQAPRGVQVPRRPDDGRTVGACSTGGVDSFHTLVRNRERIGALVYGFGLDVPVGQEHIGTQVRSLLGQVSGETGIPVLVASTNVKRVLAAGAVRWGYEGHGAVLAALGTVFASSVKRLLVPSTHTYLNPPPWGSSPLLDERWSTNRLRVTYWGGDRSRIRKTQQIADSPLAAAPPGLLQPVRHLELWAVRQVPAHDGDPGRDRPPRRLRHPPRAPRPRPPRSLRAAPGA